MESVQTTTLVREDLLDILENGSSKMLEGVNAKVYLLLNILYMKKGTYTGIPDMGFDIESRKHSLDDNISLGIITGDLKNQVSMYLSSLEVTNISISVLEEGIVNYNFSFNNNSNIKLMFDIEDMTTNTLTVEITTVTEKLNN